MKVKFSKWPGGTENSPPPKFKKIKNKKLKVMLSSLKSHNHLDLVKEVQKEVRETRVGAIVV